MGSRQTSFTELLGIGHTLAGIAGASVLPHFRKPLKVDNKLDGRGFDPVTAADRGTERAIAAHLARFHPDHGIVGEEFGRGGGDGRYQWIIDPIDGTKAFIMGSPLWGTLIGLLDGETPLLGIMDQPFTRERVWSAKSSAHWRGPDGRTRRLKTRACARLDEAILTTTSPDLITAGKPTKAFLDLKARVRMTRYGGDCYGYCLLAAGHVDLVVETGLKPYDVMALIPIIERAGGRITTWSGAPATGGGAIVAAGDPHLHEAALARLNA